MKKSNQELKLIENIINSSYSRLGNCILVDDSTKFDIKNPNRALGYCFNYRDLRPDGSFVNIYQIVHQPIGDPDVDYRIKMHEYGHIYLGHLEGIHEELDSQLMSALKDHREGIIDLVNRECGIQFGELLVDRVISDKYLNHSLHNIAMDMEVNAKVLSLEDIESMESSITKLLVPESIESVEEMPKENDWGVKLIHPLRYHFSKTGEPFPDDLTYSEYLILIVKNLDQFVKMMVSFGTGGNGDTKNISKEDIEKYFGKDAAEALEKLSKQLSSAGNSESGDGSGGDENQSNSSNSGGGGSESRKGKREEEAPGTGTGKDHCTDSRTEADKKRAQGLIKPSGIGCGSSGNGIEDLELDPVADPVEMALREVIANCKSKVIKFGNRKDLLYSYNRGINRSVISPTIKYKVSIKTNPTICFLIDVSGSMNSKLINRCICTISREMRKLNRGLRYNIIAWDTDLTQHIKDIDPRKPIPTIRVGGGTRIAKGIRFFKSNYSDDATLVIISDFEDYLEEWREVESTMANYTMYGFCYTDKNSWYYKNNKKELGSFKNLIVKEFDYK